MILSQLKTGQCGRVIKVGGEGAIRRRLLDMGITKSTVICVYKKAPFGDPIEMIVRGYKLTLRLDEAEKIEVEKC